MAIPSIIPPIDRGYTIPEIFVTTDWLAEHIDDPNVRLVDTDTPEQYELDNKKCLYGRHNSLKMGRMPATPDEGYHDPHPSAERQWFRNKTQWDNHNERERILQESYLKKKGLK